MSVSVCLSVYPSVCPSRFRVRSISFEPLVGFTNNFAQIMMRRCAVPMFDEGRFQCQGHNVILNIVSVYLVLFLMLLNYIGNSLQITQPLAKIHRNDP